jgi:hypothetical protein
VSRSRDTRRPPSLVLLALAYTPLVIPVAGWLAAQSSDDRTTEVWQFTAAWIHGLAASTFAIVFALSLLVNAVIVTTRFRDAPRSYRLTGYPLWQGLVTALGVGWAVTVGLTIESTWVEIAFGLGVAVTSIGACVQAALVDPESAERREVRLAREREARSPAQHATIRRLKVGIPVAIGAAAIIAGVLAQVLVVVHDDCDIVGTGNFNGSRSIYTETCGNFAVSTHIPQSVLDAAFYGNERVDITTQGYAFGIPPMPVIVEITW